jgi:hypothetical protein
MSRCPFATFDEISGPAGPLAGGPFKVVHHTTEGSTYAGARSAYQAHKSDPHFTVAGDDILQHIDTELAARALKNRPGGVETNRDSAVQIEIVGFAGRPKDAATLRSVARLCRWLEAEHGIPQRWPNGRPQASTNGHDPGGHNRNAMAWDTESGHYGHSQVPENDHWDPGYTAAELAIVTPDAVFDAHEELAAAGAVVREAAEISRPAGMATADVIAQAVLDRLAAADMAVLKQTSRVSMRVSADGIEIQVVLKRRVKREKTARKVTRRPQRTTTRRPRKRKRADR